MQMLHNITLHFYNIPSINYDKPRVTIKDQTEPMETSLDRFESALNFYFKQNSE